MISSPPEWSDYREAPINGNWFMRWLKSRFRYVDYPFVLAYRGFGNTRRLLVQGHVFKGMALEKPRNRYSAFRNFMSLIKMFLIRTIPGANVSLSIKEKTYSIQTTVEGFFEFELKDHGLPKGWHTVHIQLMDKIVEGQEKVELKVEVMIEDDFEYGLISDIDDTFLVSHVTKFWRKLYLLITKNAETRKPFKGVVKFYRALSNGVGTDTNPFFYVSSSEWNLYDFLINFCRFNKLPKGVLQLKDLKDHWKDFFSDANRGHDHKQIKIERIMEMYPGKKFILLGDNGQQDPHIYYALAKAYPDRVKAIYIRAVKRSHHTSVNEILREIDKMAIPSLQFRHSKEAIIHAREHGLIGDNV